MARSAKESALIAAAAALDDELVQFHDAVGAFDKLQLSSKKQLDRAAQALNELAESEQRLGAHVQALVQAVASTREGQNAEIDVIRKKAEALKTRSLEFQALIAQFELLGAGAAALNKKLQGDVPALDAVVVEVTALAGQAGTLNAAAREKGFDDVAHLADGLRQQLSALASKLGPANPNRPLPS
jgi:chromosome segregation ATPase